MFVFGVYGDFYFYSFHAARLNLLIPAHVVNQIGQGVPDGILCETDNSAEHPVQVQLAVAEYMLHTRP